MKTWQKLSILGVMVTTLSGVSWLTYSMGLNTGQADLNSYKESERWKLPELLGDLRSTSGKLRLNIDERRELDSLRQAHAVSEGTITELGGQVASLERQVQVKQKSIDAIESRLKEWEGEIFTLLEGAGRWLVPGALAIGVQDVAYDKTATITFDGEEMEIRPGTVLEHVVDGERYCITLKNADPIRGECTFSLVRPQGE